MPTSENENKTRVALTIVFSILLPPVGVAICRGLDVDVLVTLLLTILGWIPGIAYAFYVYFKKGFRARDELTTLN